MNERARKSTPATTVILTVIFVAFGLQLLGFPLVQWFSNYPPLVKRGEWWRLVTAMFLHAGLLHLIVNTIALFQLGRFYEVMFGTQRFLFIYAVSGLAASLASTFWNDDPSVGASGAIFGILGAMIFSIRRSPLWRFEQVGRNIVAQGVFLIIANLIITWTVPNIDKAGHIGGLITGLLLGALLPQQQPPPPPPAQVVIDVKPYDEP